MSLINVGICETSFGEANTTVGSVVDGVEAL